jgi:hypothetical protein
MKRMNNLNWLISFILIVFTSCHNKYVPNYIFSVKDGKTYLNNNDFILKGLRLSNALIDEKSADELISNLDTFAYYGLNSFSVYFQGSRFGDIKGYREDGSLDPVYAERMGRIIEAADKKGFVVLVGCLYWSTSDARWEKWTQKEADLAVFNTVRWLKTHNYKNIFVDVDNEGMAQNTKIINDRSLVISGKKANPNCIIATNFKGDPPPEADMGIHHSNRFPGKPYAQTEGSPSGIQGGYWGSYSKQGSQWNNGPDLYQYINIGIYTEEMKNAQIEETYRSIGNGEGYMLASTWLQCVPPDGPNARPGGYGTATDPGIRWWLDAIRARYGPYVPPPGLR